MRTRLPLVEVQIPQSILKPPMQAGPAGPEPIPDTIAFQCSPDEARSLALNLLEGAEGALGDGFLLTFLEREVGLSVEQLAPILLKFRGYRARNEAEGT